MAADEVIYYYVRGQGWVTEPTDYFDIMQKVYDNSIYETAARLLYGNTVVIYPRSITVSDA